MAKSLSKELLEKQLYYIGLSISQWSLLDEFIDSMDVTDSRGFYSAKLNAYEHVLNRYNIHGDVATRCFLCDIAKASKAVTMGKGGCTVCPIVTNKLYYLDESSPFMAVCAVSEESPWHKILKVLGTLTCDKLVLTKQDLSKIKRYCKDFVIDLEKFKKEIQYEINIKDPRRTNPSCG